VVPSHTRWLEAVIVKGTETQEVYVTFSPQFERIWLESKKRLPEYVAKEPANSWSTKSIFDKALRLGEKWASVGTKRIALEDLRKVLGPELVKNAEGNVIQEPPLPIWANFRQRALNVGLAEINRKTDLKIEVKSIERAKQRRVTFVIFSIEEQAASNSD
jgi:plasmid replication initiation protein